MNYFGKTKCGRFGTINVYEEERKDSKKNKGNDVHKWCTQLTKNKCILHQEKSH